MNFSRMDLADCGAPEALLAVIEKLEGPGYPVPVPIEAWALALDITAINALEADGFEGSLVMLSDRSAGTILVSKVARPERRRFTIAHELGHFLIPSHTPRDGRAFLCSKKDMGLAVMQPGGDRYVKMEVEANRFAAGVLMPAGPFRSALRAIRHFEVGHVAELAQRFEVSKEACARRCVDLHDDPLAVIFTKDGLVERVYRGPEFPYLVVERKARLPGQRSAPAQGKTSEWSDMPADQWLTRGGGTICEQSLGQANGWCMTLLTYESDESDDED